MLGNLNIKMLFQGEEKISCFSNSWYYSIDPVDEYFKRVQREKEITFVDTAG